MYTFSISVLIQALVVISMSGAADHGRFRKTFLLFFAFVGSICTMFFLPVVPKVYYIASVLAIIANTCFGASFVLLNSFLPLLVRHHPDIRAGPRGTPQDVPVIIVDGGTGERPLAENEEDLDDSTAALLASPARSDARITNRHMHNRTSPALQLSTKISSYGIGVGYMAAMFVQVISILVIVTTDSGDFSLRLVLFVIGAWWFLFTIPAALWLRPRPGPPLEFGKTRKASAISYVVYAWRSLGRTIVRARCLKDVMLFLAAWFLISDAIATVSGTAVLFAKTTLQMKPAALALINVVVTLFGILSAFAWSHVSRFFGLQPNQTVLVCICIFELIPIYGLLGYLPFIRRLGAFGLQQQWEMYPLGAVYGIVLGGLSSYCRSLFGELIPPGSEAAFYALYAITDKGSSVFGPAIVGAITDVTGEIRPVGIPPSRTHWQSRY